MHLSIESAEQIALFKWIRVMSNKYPSLKCIYHTPNGERRDIATAVKLRNMGVQAGVWDIYVPVPTPGLWIEMKSKTGSLTDSQVAFKERLEPHGYKFVVATSWIQAKEAIELHLNILDAID